VYRRQWSGWYSWYIAGWYRYLMCCRYFFHILDLLACLMSTWNPLLMSVWWRQPFSGSNILSNLCEFLNSAAATATASFLGYRPALLLVFILIFNFSFTVITEYYWGGLFNPSLNFVWLHWNQVKIIKWGRTLKWRIFQSVWRHLPIYPRKRNWPGQPEFFIKVPRPKTYPWKSR